VPWDLEETPTGCRVALTHLGLYLSMGALIFLLPKSTRVDEVTRAGW